MKTTFNNGQGSRGRRHLNFLVFQGTAVEFTGKTFPGCRVLREDYTQNGKWSKTTWECDLADGVEAFVFSQDWETGEWFPEKTWEAATSRPDLPLQGDDCARFIRAHFPKTAARLDEEAAAVASSPDLAAVFADLRAAQEEEAAARRDLEVEVKGLEVLAQAEEARARAAKLKSLKGKKLSLEQLREVLA